MAAISTRRVVEGRGGDYGRAVRVSDRRYPDLVSFGRLRHFRDRRHAVRSGLSGRQFRTRKAANARGTETDPMKLLLLMLCAKYPDASLVIGCRVAETALLAGQGEKIAA